MTSDPINSQDQTIPTVTGGGGSLPLIAEKYQVIERLGKGGMGSVYKVRHILFDKVYALKILDADRMLDGVQLRRFQQEAKSAHALNHVNLIKVHDLGLMENGQPYLVMDLVEGKNLAEVLKSNGPMTLESARSIFRQLCDGLEAAHQKGIVHRDIKPSNIMLVDNLNLSQAGSVKIVDFGIAKIAAQSKSQAITNTGEIFGSPFYMSPEQCAGGLIDRRSDIYSLGCVLFEALTGAPPFMGQNALRTMKMHESNTVLSLKEASMGKAFPIEVERMVSKMLEKKPEDRYQDMSTISRELSADFHSTGTGNVTGSKTSHSMTIAFWGLVVLAVVCIGNNYLQNSKSLGKEDGGYGSKSPASAATVAAKSLITSTATAVKPTREKEKYKTAEAPEMLNYLRDNTGSKTVSGSGPRSLVPIKISRSISSNGVRIVQFDFPSYPIGTVSDSLAGEHINQRPNEHRAVGTVVMPDEPLTLVFDFESTPEGFPGDYKRLGLDDFEGLEIKGRMLESFNGAENLQDHKFAVDALNYAANWSNLHSVALHFLSLDESVWRGLENLPQLENLIIDTPLHGFGEMKHAQFLHNLKRLWLTKGVLEPLTNSLSGSNHLEKLVVIGCDVSDKSIDNLRQCYGLKILQLLQPEVTEHQIQILASLRKIEKLNLSRCALRESDVNLLRKNPSLKSLIVSPQTFTKLRASGMNDPRISTVKP